MAELHVGVLAAAAAQHLPHVFAEADLAAVQRVGAVVGGELVLLAIELERGAGDAVAVAADELAQIRGVLEIGTAGRGSDSTSGMRLPFTGSVTTAQRATQREDFGLQAVRAAERGDLDFLAIGKPAERCESCRALRRLGRAPLEKPLQQAEEQEQSSDDDPGPP